MNKENWLKDFEEFMNGDPVPVPLDASNGVQNRISKLMNPSSWTVFFKILGVHSIVGLFSMAICHQFEMNPFNTSFSLADWFMHVGGHNVCMLGCGFFFIATGIGVSGYFLSIEEIRALRRTEFPQTFALGVASIALFAVFGAELALTFTGLWLLGGLVGGYLATEILWKIKTIQTA